MKNDEYYMNLAIEIAKKGIGKVSPNPLVGCIIVKNGNILAEGYHEVFGGPHAEVNAINQVEGDLSDCDVYVTLEPCTHYGKTPPCVDLLIKKKPKRVIIAMEDPNPVVKGNGLATLEVNGIEVKLGVLENEAQELNYVYINNILEKRPYITAKFAMTLDGFIAEKNHNSRWISCEESRTDVHKIRSEVDAILVGSGTIRQDNPQLNVRLVEGENPLRIVFASHLNLPLKSYILTDEIAKSKTIIFCTNDAQNIKLVNQLRENEINVIPVSKDKDGKIDISVALDILYKEYQVGHILLEGGSKMFSTFFKQKLIDKIIIYHSPKILGVGLSPFPNQTQRLLLDEALFKLSEYTQSGEDLKSVWIKNG